MPSQHHTGTTTGPDRYGGHLAMASQRPVATTSVSGLTSEGYISTDALQSHSHVSYVQRADTHVAMPPGGGGFSSLDTSKFPRVYVEVYKKCVEGGTGGLLNTERLFPLLLSSQLPTDVLRDLWSQANRGVPGKLNQTELFVLLGLIGLVQVCMSLFLLLLLLLFLLFLLYQRGATSSICKSGPTIRTVRFLLFGP